jgi:multiple sugar transport system substrate-binding protein
VSWGMGVYSGTQHKSAADKFLAWATSKALAVEGMAQSITMARNSAWIDGAQYMNPELVASRKNAAENGYQYDRPFITSVGKARDLIGEVVIESINSKGTSEKIPAMAAEKAAAVDEIMKADGEYHNLPY